MDRVIRGGVINAQLMTDGKTGETDQLEILFYFFKKIIPQVS